jgi:hypothetical protein
MHGLLLACGFDMSHCRGRGAQPTLCELLLHCSLQARTWAFILHRLF